MFLTGQADLTDFFATKASAFAKATADRRCWILLGTITVFAYWQDARTAGVEHLIEFNVCDFADTEVPEGEGIVVMNPEYGLRLGDLEPLEKEYKRIGDFFKQKCAGYTGYLFIGNKLLAAKVGLKASRRMIFYNGNIECRLLKYELYKGTRH